MTSLLLLLTGALSGAFDEPQEPVLSIEQAAQATIHLKGFPDWLELGFGSLWVSNLGLDAVQRIDPQTNKVIAEIKVNKPCAAMAADYGSLWVASYKDKSIVRIDAGKNEVATKIPVMIADTEASIAAGEGGVWLVTDRKGILSRIDPQTNRVVAEIRVQPHSYAAMASYGAIWVTSTGKPGAKEPGSVERIDPRTNTVIARIPVRVQPRFLAVGEGAVWVLNQGDGSVSRIDPKTNQVTATVEVGAAGPGGDIAAGEGAVWVRGSKVLLSVIDPQTNKVVKHYGPAQGSGAVRAGNGSVWVSAHDVNKVWRLDPLPKAGNLGSIAENNSTAGVTRKPCECRTPRRQRCSFFSRCRSGLVR
jgi:YVTN family beta-propeller protein